MSALEIISTLRQATRGMGRPAGDQIVERYGRDPYLVLISCILSLRTKDTVSFPASCRLFEQAKGPHEMVRLSLLDIKRAIYPVGFYQRKSAQILSISVDIITRFDGKVPSGEQELLSLAGVGRKTMNLVRALGFGIPALCVDVHVHRISNRLGLVNTKTPEETEIALSGLLPPEYWIEYNSLLVMWGQNICVPVSPHCSRCPILTQCQRVGVTRSR